MTQEYEETARAVIGGDVKCMIKRLFKWFKRKKKKGVRELMKEKEDLPA